MILVDFNQVVISNYMANQNSLEGYTTENIIRHMVLNSLRYYRLKFNSEYGELVICVDSPSWRISVFPNYKKCRKKNREKSSVNWDELYSCLDQIKDELQRVFPYKVLRVEGAEADDIISVLCRKIPDKKMIISGDKDFRQLQTFDGVAQYSPIKKEIIIENRPEEYLREHILIGDVSDGVPNYLSDDDVFINETKRQTPIRKVKLAEWIQDRPENFCNQEQLRNYHRNRMLVDLINCIPPDVEERILEEYNKPIMGHRAKILTYMMENELNNLMDSLQDF